MLALPLLLMISAGAAPAGGTALVVLRQSGMSEREAAALTAQVHQALSAETTGVALDTAPFPCSDRADCAYEVGRELGREVVVALDLAALRNSCALHLEAVSIEDGVRLVVRDIVAPRKGLTGEAKASLAEFARHLAAVRVKPVAAPDVPRALGRDLPSQREKQAVALGPGAVERPRPKRSAWPWITGGGAAACAVASIAFGVVGLSAASSLPAEDAQTDLTYPQAIAARDRANTSFGASAGTAGAAVLLGVATFLLMDEGTP